MPRKPRTMVIFDSEKRPRGLRVPSLTAMKNGSAASLSQFSFHNKKSPESRTPDEDSTPTTGPGFFPAPPPRAAPPPSKDLPAIPREQLPAPLQPSPMVPPRRQVGGNARISENPAPTPQGLRRAAPPRSQTPPAPVPVILSPPAGADSEALTPLEDFIPTPDGTGTPREPVSSGEQASPYTPPLEAEPIAAPLNQVHFACFQEHRNMPVAQNVWCPVPCMTCLKFDRKDRHRCVFCCLRICEGCHQALMKCENRSLAELMNNLNHIR